MKDTYTYEQAYEACLKFFDGNELASRIVVDKYLLRTTEGQFVEKDPNDMFRRIAHELARVEEKKFKNPLSEDEIFELLRDFRRIIPQGSPLYGIGNKYQNVSLSNCFEPSTLVYTDKGVKQIEDVCLGDLVITHKNRWRKVSQVHFNPIAKRQVYEIKCFHTPVFRVTGNHRFLSISKEQLKWNESPSWNSIEYLRSGDYIAIPNSEEHGTVSDIDVASVLGPNPSSGGKNYLINVSKEKVQLTTKQRRHNAINRIWKVDSDFAYFLGLWYGNGCVFSDTSNESVRGVTFTLNERDSNIGQFISDYGQKLLGLKSDVNNNGNIDGSLQIVFNGAAVGIVFETLFGRGCRGKRMWSQIFTWPKLLVERLVQGLVDSDGCVTTTGDLRVVLSNVRLIEEFYHLLRSFGFNVGITYGVNGREYCRLDFGRHTEFARNCKKRYEDGRLSNLKVAKQNQNEIVIDGRIFVRISRKEKTYSRFESFVTLGVDEDHSYSVVGLVAENCFVTPPVGDSFGAIHRTDEYISQIAERRGGQGFDLSPIRPAGFPTKNSSRTATGVVSFMERFSNSGREVGAEGRRAALMMTISVHHPDVVAFINSKRDRSRITGANISVRYTDEFLEAVANDTEYEQRWPVDAKEPKFRQMVRARDVWKHVVDNSWENGEPGILFWSRILRESVADIYEDFKSSSTNPCSELILSSYDSCRLLLLNLLTYVNQPFTDKSHFDFDRFYADAKIAQRLMDDVVDLEIESVNRIIEKVKNDPEADDIKHVELDMWQQVRKYCELGRRTGTGITALGDTLAACGLKYDSNDAIKMTGEIYRTLKHACYESSIEMAEEIGAFPVFDAKLEADVNHPYLCRLATERPDLWERMLQNGRRNIALLTTAPAGTVSCLAFSGIDGETRTFGTSSGIEPVFQISYIRRKKITGSEENARVDFVDAKGDKWQNFEVFHPTVDTWRRITGKTDIKESPWFGSCAEELDWKQRVELQAVATRELEHSCSSTLNLPENVKKERVDEIFLTAWKAGCKGITVYRKNCRSGVLIDVESSTKPSKIKKTKAPKRPRSLPCEVHHLSVKGTKYGVIVGLLDGDPYEVLVSSKPIPAFVVKGNLVRVKRGEYNLVYASKLNGETKSLDGVSHCDAEEEALLRMTSTALRHGADIAFVVQQLEKTKGEMHGFAKSVARTLKKYVPDGTLVTGENCPDCGGSDLRRQEGCVSCQSCSWSKCS